MAAFSQVTVEKGLHQAAALAAMTLLITAHRAIMNTGFVLRRRGWSTDFLTILTTGLVTSAWTLLVVVSGLFIGDQPCRNGLEPCVTRLSYAPWIIQLLFVFWVVAYLDEVCYLRWKEARRATGESSNKDPYDAEARGDTGKDISRIFADQTNCPKDVEARGMSSTKVTRRSQYLKPLGIWKMECCQGPLNWSGSVHWTFRLVLYSAMTIVILFCSYGAARQELYTMALLNVVGVILFIVGAGGANKYSKAPHTYTKDTLRIILQTDHKEGTIYILPTKHRGFDAVWSPKVESEHRAIDEAVADWRLKGGYNSPNVPDILPVLATFHAATQLEEEDIVSLADWLYNPEGQKQMCQMHCIRAPGIHLLARSVMLALWSAEYLVFMRQGDLRDDQRKCIGKLRGQRWTGAEISREVRQVGSLPGLQGYQEAVRYVYQLFDQSVDPDALNPTASPPKESVVLSPCPGKIEDYVAQLWDLCIAQTDSTFAALYSFTQYWDSDIGGGHGWHQFPLRAIDREGDIVSWHIIWRQAWYLAIVAQLTSMSPVIFSAFVAGILQ